MFLKRWTCENRQNLSLDRSVNLILDVLSNWWKWVRPCSDSTSLSATAHRFTWNPVLDIYKHGTIFFVSLAGSIYPSWLQNIQYVHCHVWNPGNLKLVRNMPGSHPTKEWILVQSSKFFCMSRATGIFNIRGCSGSNGYKNLHTNRTSSTCGQDLHTPSRSFIVPLKTWREVHFI